MHGCGNDYIYIDCFKESLPEDPGALKDLIVRLSDRHFGIGGDGVILIDRGRKAPFEMRMYNADGSYSKMCGNGIRCVAKYLWDNGYIDPSTVLPDENAAAGGTYFAEFGIESGGEVKKIRLALSDGKDGKKEVRSVTVNMGPAILDPEKIPVRIPGFPGRVPEAVKEIPGNGKAPLVLGVPIQVGGREFKMTCVSMGNPHAVVFLDELPDDEMMKKFGPLFETHEYFPEKVNTEFVLVKDRHRVRMRVWERGTGETLACGTGTCAVTVAAILNGYCESPVTVEVTGGEVTDAWDREKNEVFMTGPAVTVFEGETLISR